MTQTTYERHRREADEWIIDNPLSGRNDWCSCVMIGKPCAEALEKEEGPQVPPSSATDDGARDHSPGAPPSSSSSANAGGGGTTMGQAPADASPAGTEPTAAVTRSDSPSPSVGHVRCKNCKTMVRPNLLCTNCGVLAPPLPSDKYPGQTDVIPY